MICQPDRESWSQKDVNSNVKKTVWLNSIDITKLVVAEKYCFNQDRFPFISVSCNTIDLCPLSICNRTFTSSIWN